MKGLKAAGGVEDDAEVTGERRGEGGGALVWVDLWLRGQGQHLIRRSE